jgi:hypothetical protein
MRACIAVLLGILSLFPELPGQEAARAVMKQYIITLMQRMTAEEKI